MRKGGLSFLRTIFTEQDGDESRRHGLTSRFGEYGLSSKTCYFMKCDVALWQRHGLIILIQLLAARDDLRRVVLLYCQIQEVVVI